VYRLLNPFGFARRLPGQSAVFQGASDEHI